MQNMTKYVYQRFSTNGSVQTESFKRADLNEQLNRESDKNRLWTRDYRFRQVSSHTQDKFHRVNASRNTSETFSSMKQLLNERICALFRSNWQHTLTYWSVFFSFGLCVAFLGPTILDLRCQTQSTLQEITLVFFSQQFCLFIGSTIGGFFSKTWVFWRDLL